MYWDIYNVQEDNGDYKVSHTDFLTMDPSYFILFIFAFINPGVLVSCHQAVGCAVKTESRGRHTFCPPTAHRVQGLISPNQLDHGGLCSSQSPCNLSPKSSLGWKEFGITAGFSFLGPAHCCPLTLNLPRTLGSGE